MRSGSAQVLRRRIEETVACFAQQGNKVSRSRCGWGRDRRASIRRSGGCLLQRVERATTVRHARGPPERLSMFSDGVFAVLIAVLVLELRPPKVPTFLHSRSSAHIA
jgi:hypothetical protein